MAGPRNHPISREFEDGRLQGENVDLCTGVIAYREILTGMTHDILQSDIEIARRLRDGNRPDEEILQTLARRGVASDKAAELLDDLRNGRRVVAREPLGMEFVPRRRPTPESSTGHESPAPERRRRHGSRSAPQNVTSAQLFRRIFLVLVGVAVLAVGVGIYLHFRAKAADQEQPGQSAPETGAVVPKPQASAAVSSPSRSGNSPTLELRSDGLHIKGNLVARDNPLPAVIGAFGAPSRTNLVAESGVAIYAYDQLGILVYVNPPGKTNRVMLDCDATGGTNGTTTAFGGLIKIEDQVIGPETDAKALAGLKRFGVSSVRSDGSLWGGHYGSVELVLAYLKSQQHLSLIEIDLE
jgi:hypothetical protein